MNNTGLIWTLIILVISSANAGRWLTTEDGERFYMEIEYKFSWSEAINECAQRNMTLISMDSPKKTQDVYNLFKTSFDTTNRWFWTGGHDHNVSRHFEWLSTGEAFGYTNWDPYQPNSDNEHCVFMFTAVALKWFDYNCNDKNGFVCEETLPQQVRNAESVLLKASSDNQTNLLKEKTEELDSLKKELEKCKKKSLQIRTNLELELDELRKFYELRLEEIKEMEGKTK